MDIEFSAFQWLYVVIIAPIFGWFGGWLRSWFIHRRLAHELVTYLCGFPLEAKAELIKFNFYGAHTLCCDALSPPIRLLVDHGVLRRGPGAGGYDATDRYFTVRPDIREVMDRWVRVDGSVIPLLKEFFDK